MPSFTTAGAQGTGAGSGGISEKMAGKGALLAVLMCGAVMVWMAEGAIDYGTEITPDLEPCINYVTTGTGVPPSNCCAVVRSLAAMATTTTPTTADKRAACLGLQKASGLPGVNGNAVFSLTGACNVKLPFPFPFPFPVNMSTDCNTIE
eukprot:Gb_31400 [translate_table: standard]